MAGTTLIRNVSVVDTTAGELRPPADLVLRGGLIAQPGSALVEDVPANIIDGRGLYACPGLIDCHTHLFLDAGSDPRGVFLATTDAEKLRTAAINAAIALQTGVTTIRDCGAPAPLIFRFKAAVENGIVPGPRILTCGAPLTRPRGHCHFFGIEVDDADAVRRAIDAQVRMGATFVKVIASGGGLTPGTRPAEADFPIELMRVAVEAARANGIYVTAHCHATESIERAIHAGVEIVEHATFLNVNGEPRFEADLVRQMCDRGMVVSPTVISGMRIAESIRRTGHRNGDDLNAVERLEARRRNLGLFFEQGIEIIAGTDCGVPNTTFDSLPHELSAYVEAGMSAAAALKSATSGSARHLRRPDLGVIRPGAPADVLLLRSNPLEDIQALGTPVAIFKAGELVCDYRTVSVH
jgi:imidazolonepropionase-like amidohydrolase